MHDWAIVTGASSGIGKNLAIELAKRSYNLVLVARSRPQLEQLATEVQRDYGIATHIVTLDLMLPGSAVALEKALSTQGIKVKVLVNNAGVGYQGKFVDQDQERIEKMMILNMQTVTALTRIFAAKMAAEGGGYILQLGSTAAFQPLPRLAVYAATKSYVLSFSRAINYELKDKNVSLTVLCPGPTKSNFWDSASMTKIPLSLQKLLMDSTKVAQLGIKGLFAKKQVVVPGLINKIQVFNARFTPSSWLIRVIDKVMNGDA